MLVLQSTQHSPFLCLQLFLCAPKSSGELSYPSHSTQLSQASANTDWATHENNRDCGSRIGLLAPSPHPSSWASAGCKLWGQCCGHQFCSEAFQVGAEAWKGSACCIRQLQPCKGQGCFGKELFAEASPSPRSLLLATGSCTHTPACAHTLTLCSAFGSGEAPHQDTAPHSQHTCAMNQGLCSSAEAPSMALEDLISSVPTP